MFSVHEDLTTVGWIVGQHDVLQARLQVLVLVGRDEIGRAGAVTFGRPVGGFIRVERLAKHEIVGVGSTAVGNNSGWPILCDVGRHHPGLHGVFVGGVDQLVKFRTARGGALSFAVQELNAPAADPVVAPAQRKIQRRFYTAGVERGAARAGLEFVEGNDVVLVATRRRDEMMPSVRFNALLVTSAGSISCRSMPSANSVMRASISLPFWVQVVPAVVELAGKP